MLACSTVAQGSTQQQTIATSFVLFLHINELGAAPYLGMYQYQLFLSTRLDADLL
jgi:hypothetical protein